MKDNKRDTLVINTNTSGSIGYDQDFKIFGTTPFKSFDTTKIAIIDKESTGVSFSSAFDTISNTLALNFYKNRGE